MSIKEGYIMERIKNLDRYQKAILLLLAAMFVCFTAAYSIVSSRVGFAYMGSILLPSEDNGSTVYSGVIQRKQAVFTVSEDKTVTFRYGDKVYGAYTAMEDPSAVPEEHSMGSYMTGIEVRNAGEVIFRGAIYKTGSDKTDLLLLSENGDFAGLTITATMNDGTVVDSNGSVVDQMEPSVLTILQLMEGPELTGKGEWKAWFLGVFLSIATACSILFADELFRWNLAFQIRNSDSAEPSEWELSGRYFSWTVLTIMTLVFYIMGLK